MEPSSEPASTELDFEPERYRCVEELLQADIERLAAQQEGSTKNRRRYTKRSLAEKISGAITAGKRNRAGSRLSRHNAAKTIGIQESDLDRSPSETEMRILASQVVSAIMPI